MSTLAILDSIRDFLKEKVAPDIKLQKSDEDVTKYELVNPEAHTGWIPPAGYLPTEMKSAIPCWVVGMDDGFEDAIESGLNVRIGAVVYSPGLHTPDENGGWNYTPDFQGYRDLLNMIDKSVLAFKRHQFIKGISVVQDTIKWGMYPESAYPYWYGWITITAKKIPGYIVSENIEKFL